MRGDQITECCTPDDLGITAEQFEYIRRVEKEFGTFDPGGLRVVLGFAEVWQESDIVPRIVEELDPDLARLMDKITSGHDPDLNDSADIHDAAQTGFRARRNEER